MKSLPTKESSFLQSLLRPFLFFFFLTLMLQSGPVKAQSEENFHNLINTTLKQTSAIQDSIRRELSKISYVMSSSQQNINFYLDPTWQSSFIITNNDQVYFFNGRLNAVDHAIEIKFNDQIRTIHPDQLKVVSIGSRTFLPVEGKKVRFSDKRMVYLEVLSFGDINLLVHYYYRSKMGGNNRLSINTNGGSFTIIPIYYIAGARGKLTKLRTSKRRILNLFNGKGEEVEAFIKKNRLRFSETEHLEQIFDYYNGLVRE